MIPHEAVYQAIEKKCQEDSEFRKKLGEGISASLEKAGLEAVPIETAAESILSRGTLERFQ